jgi:hypothetical protein
MKPEYRESPYPGDRIDKELWTSLRNTIFEDGHLCYHDDEGCHYVLREIIEVLKKYSINKKQESPNEEKIKTELFICDSSFPLTMQMMIEVSEILFKIANEAGLKGVRFKDFTYCERMSSPLSLYKMFKWDIDA